MRILMDSGGLAMTNCFLVADEVAKEAVIFDAPDHTVDRLLDEAEKNGWKVVGLWLTHGHFDHLADHPAVTRRFADAKVVIHRLEEKKLQQPNTPALFPLPFTIPGRSADVLVEDGQKLNVGGIAFEVIHTPGHSPGHVVYHCPTEKIAVGGDLIIMGAVGRTDFPDADPVTMNDSIRRVMKLPGDTKLLPGHGEISTLDEERAGNYYVQQALRNQG